MYQQSTFQTAMGRESQPITLAIVALSGTTARISIALHFPFYMFQLILCEYRTLCIETIDEFLLYPMPHFAALCLCFIYSHCMWILFAQSVGCEYLLLIIIRAIGYYIVIGCIYLWWWGGQGERGKP